MAEHAEAAPIWGVSAEFDTAEAMLAALRRGDRVVTAGGILATVQKVKEGSDEIEVDLAPNVRVTVLRDTITSVFKPVVANDTKPA